MPITKSKQLNSTSTEGLITCLAQQSRFKALDTEDSNLKDYEVNDLCLQIGEHHILQHARLLLKTGVRYAFVGRNGSGKSTVLKAIGHRLIPGIPPNLRILLLDQTIVEDKSQSAKKRSSLTVLQHVLSEDKLRSRLVNDAARLSAVIGSQSNEHEPAKVVGELQLEKARRELDAARLVAQHRSKALGSKARQEEIKHENLVTEAEGQLAGLTVDPVGDLQKAVSMLEDIRAVLNGMDAHSTEARAQKALVGLGFSDEQINGPISKLSGGWHTRASLAAVLIQQTDILLLDEPTNFLDLPAVIWLQHYLVNELSPTTAVLVTSHDRDFVDAVAQRLLILRMKPAHTLETFNGTLSDYYAERYRQIKRMTRMSDALEKKKANLESAIQKNICAARKSGDDKKMKVAASKKKKLNDRMGLEVSAKGHRFKLNRDMGSYGTSMRGAIEIPEFDPDVHMAFPSDFPDLRTTGNLVSLENVSHTYAGTRTPTLQNITLTISPKSRTGLVGLNGSGKSTLVNLITSTIPYSPTTTRGTIAHHPTARISYYTQHTTSTLTHLGREQPHLTALSHLHSLHPTLPEQTLRALLSGLALPSQTQSHTPLSHLSGGQLVRVGLAQCLLPHPPHLLILDEPTTHLDADSILALIRALKRYPGAILAVSHDRYFIRCVVEGQSSRGAVRQGDDEGSSSGSDGSSDEDDEDEGMREPGRVYRLTRTSGKMILLQRGMDEYEEIIERQVMRREDGNG